MRLRLTNTDAAGDPVTTRLTVTVDGDRHTFDVASTGTIQVPEHVGEYLLDSGATVEEYSADDSDTTES